MARSKTSGLEALRNSPDATSTSNRFYRLGGTMVLHDGLGVATVTYDMFLENRSDEGTCLFRGTATSSGLIR